MIPVGHDQLKTQKSINVDDQSYVYFSLKEATRHFPVLKQLPFSLKILLENLLRFENGQTVTVDDIKALADWVTLKKSSREIAFRPTRVLMQDFTGVPAVVDLAAMREAMVKLGGDPHLINPLIPVDLVIDHSVMVDSYGSEKSFSDNVKKEYQRNHERYSFLKWGQGTFKNFRVVPPGTGICHQVNLEHLAQVVWTDSYQGKTYAFPDTLVGTDSHTTMVNSLAVLGWGVGGIEAEAAMLGQPISMLIPEVVGFKLKGCQAEGTTATDLVLTVTQMLRTHGVVNKFVEFYGDGLNSMSLADRATISNMAPEYGATCGFFPIDAETIRYLKFTSRHQARVNLIEVYAKTQGLWHDHTTVDPVFSQTLELDLSTIVPTLAGPKRPQDKVFITKAVESITKAINDDTKTSSTQFSTKVSLFLKEDSINLTSGDVVIAAITSCTNTSNPSVMMGAGLLAKNALEKGLKVKPWVKTSLAPGSQVVTDYLKTAGLQKPLDQLGFNLVGYGCTTCIGNSGPLLPEISQAIEEHDLGVVSVLSGNRNFEGRIHPQVKYSYLASPLHVIAYALAGSMKVDLNHDPLGFDNDNKPVYLKEIWPSNQKIQETIEQCLTPEMFQKRYSEVFKGDKEWQRLQSPSSLTYIWQSDSTYIKLPPFFETLQKAPALLHQIKGARILALLGDSITTDHISPAGAIKPKGPAGNYLSEHQVEFTDFNSYGSRRGNHEVMMRGTFANTRLKNELVPDKTGGITLYHPTHQEMSIFEASMKYQQDKTPLVIIAGLEYGTGSSRDWAAKGTCLLGIKAVIAESFERIHRSNLVGMGILPLEFKSGMNRKTLGLTGQEHIDLSGFEQNLSPRMDIECVIHDSQRTSKTIMLTCRIDTLEEVEYFKNGGILPYVLRSLAS